MRNILTSFASAEYADSLRELERSACAFGIDKVFSWDPNRIRATAFYDQNRAVLDSGRGCGYWLWKPYIIGRALAAADEKDILVYADAGVSVVQPLQPLFDLCRETAGLLVFAGHYDGLAAQLNTCGRWTKRDCFILMDCDRPEVHAAPMLDASFLVLRKTERSIGFVKAWLELCKLSAIVTDLPNTCGKRNLPGFVAHRHDQSVLSLLAARNQVEVFRSASQFGNHCKLERCRKAGEWIRKPYASDGIYRNSDYGTLLFHHRKRMLTSRWQDDSIVSTTSLEDLVVALISPGTPSVRFLEIMPRGLTVAGNGSTDRLARLPLRYVQTKLEERADYERLRGGHFEAVLSRSPFRGSIVSELERLHEFDILSRHGAVVCWTGLDDITGWSAFRLAQSFAHEGLRRSLLFTHYGWPTAGVERQTIGIMHLGPREQ